MVTMNLYKYRKKINYRFLIFLSVFCVLFLNYPLISEAETIDYEAEAALRKELPIQSNETYGWPEGPEVSAEAAIVLEVNTGTILYAKNIHEELYPASTTKIMTCLLAAENASLSDTITFSHDAVFSVPSDGSSIGMDVGESITMEQALYGIMVGSANEAANAVAEHVSGSIDSFVDLMNERAIELGCQNTHFNNTNGLQDENHYTSAYDLALIAAQFFENDLLCKIGNTPRYHFTPTATQPDDFYLNNTHKLITGEISYEGIVGGKTGYTSLARETLVTCAERGGMKLVCVVLKEESPTQFNDTVTLFDYGFNNFEAINVSENDTRYMPDDSLFFESEHDVFGKSGTILNISSDDMIIIPKTNSIEDTGYEVTYDLSEEDLSENPSAIAKVMYDFNGISVGKAYVCYSPQIVSSDKNSDNHSHTIYVNVKFLIFIAGIFVILATIIASIFSYIYSNRKLSTRSDRIRYNRRKKEYKRTKFNSKKL